MSADLQGHDAGCGLFFGRDACDCIHSLAMLRGETMGPLGAILPVEPEPEPALDLEQARTHAAQLIIAAIEKQGERSVPDLIAWLDSIGDGRPMGGAAQDCFLTAPKLSTLWSN